MLTVTSKGRRYKRILFRIIKNTFINSLKLVIPELDKSVNIKK